MKSALLAWICLCVTAIMAVAQLPAIPEPPVILHGTVTDKTNNQPVTITSVTWQVTDGTTNRSYSAATLPATRVVDQTGQSFYVLEVPHETRVIQTAGGTISLQPSSSGFEVKTPAPTYTLTALINGAPATIKAVDGNSSPPGTDSATLDDYTPATQGRMMRVDLWINEDPYLAWAAGYFVDPNAPEAAPSFDLDGDGQTNDQERLAGTDPTNGNSALRLANFSRAPDGTSFTLTWQSTSGKTYHVESCATLATPDWQIVGDPVIAAGPISSLVVPTTPGESRRFFRVRVLP